MGISASAVSKAIARLEARLGVRLFHRSTRTVSLTPEGVLFLERCRNILSQVESAEAELLHAQGAPRGKLRISVPSVGALFMGRLAEFKRRYPDIALEIDCSDRFVDVIEEGFDAVIRTGQLTDSRLAARRIGACRKILVAAPDYLLRAGAPSVPAELSAHECILYRYPNTGKLDLWPWDGALHELPASAIANTLEPQLCLAVRGAGLAYVPEIAVRQQLRDGSLVAVLEQQVTQELVFYVLWPSSQHLPSKVRVFVDFIAEHLFPL